MVAGTDTEHPLPLELLPEGRAETLSICIYRITLPLHPLHADFKLPGLRLQKSTLTQTPVLPVQNKI